MIRMTSDCLCWHCAGHSDSDDSVSLFSMRAQGRLILIPTMPCLGCHMFSTIHTATWLSVLSVPATSVSFRPSITSCQGSIGLSCLAGCAAAAGGLAAEGRHVCWPSRGGCNFTAAQQGPRKVCLCTQAAKHSLHTLACFLRAIQNMIVAAHKMRLPCDVLCGCWQCSAG